MYRPKRDYRFEYVTDLMLFIEEMQCKGCAFKGTDPDFPMMGCAKGIDGQLLVEDSQFAPVEALDDKGDDGVVCTAYRNELLAEEEHPDQGRLL